MANNNDQSFIGGLLTRISIVILLMYAIAYGIDRYAPGTGAGMQQDVKAAVINAARATNAKIW
jgi:hypothetical protein